MKVRVECYAGNKADERPVRFYLGEQLRMVEDILDQWYGPNDIFFKVRADDGNLYILSTGTSNAGREWSFESFRGAKPRLRLTAYTRAVGRVSTSSRVYRQEGICAADEF